MHAFAFFLRWVRCPQTSAFTCPCYVDACRLLKRDLNKQERASDAGLKSSAMGVIPFKVNDDLRAQLQTFGSGEGGLDWIEMVRQRRCFCSSTVQQPCRCSKGLVFRCVCTGAWPWLASLHRFRTSLEPNLKQWDTTDGTRTGST